MIMGNKQVDYQIRTDHKNRNGFDNRRSNLRECTPSQNSANTKHTNKHGFRGVFSNYKNLVAYIRISQKHIFLGNYDNPEQAAQAYDTAATKHFGEFATLNFPQG